MILIATGAEIHLALEAQPRLLADGIRARVVSLPSTELFARQPPEYRERVLPAGLPLLIIEAGTPLGWRSYIGPSPEVIGVEGFGASAPGDELLRRYGFTVENVCRRAVDLLLERRMP